MWYQNVCYDVFNPFLVTHSEINKYCRFKTGIYAYVFRQKWGMLQGESSETYNYISVKQLHLSRFWH